MIFSVFGLIFMLFLQESCSDQFNMADTDQSGKVSLDEYLTSINASEPPQNFSENDFENADEDADGELTFSEFVGSLTDPEYRGVCFEPPAP